MKAVFEKQVGGIHYKDYKIPPVKFIHANGLGFLEGCIVKRLCRYRAKGGLEDLKKIQHETELLIALEYPEHKHVPAESALDNTNIADLPLKLKYFNSSEVDNGWI